MDRLGDGVAVRILIGITAGPPPVIMFTFGASMCSVRLTVGITADPTAAGVRSIAVMPAYLHFSA